MIRVLHVIDHLGLGGAQSAVLDMVTNSDASKVQPEVAVMHGRGLFADALEGAGVKVHVLAEKKWPPTYILSLMKLVAGGGYDVLHFHLQGANWLGKPLCAMASIRTKRVAHDHSSADLRFRGRWSVVPDGLTHLLSHRVIAVSEGVADFLNQHEAVSRKKLRVVSNGVDTKIFVPTTKEARARAREILGLRERDFVVGALGRLAPEKNFTAVIELAKKLPQMQFVIGGSGPEESALREKIGGLRNCHLLGQIADRPAFYAALDVYLLSSLHEALPMTVLEAMASGVPLVASNLEGVAAAIDGVGVLVEAGNVEEMSEALEKLERDEMLRKELAEGGRERCEQEFSATKTAKEMEQIYQELVN